MKKATVHRYRDFRVESAIKQSGFKSISLKEVGRGKVFATPFGHNFFTYGLYFRIILLRAMAWTINESFDPFKPLLNLHNERKVLR